MSSEIPKFMRESYALTGPVAMSQDLFSYVEELSQKERILYPDSHEIRTEEELVSIEDIAELQKAILKVKQDTFLYGEQQNTSYTLEKDYFRSSINLNDTRIVLARTEHDLIFTSEDESIEMYFSTEDDAYYLSIEKLKSGDDDELQEVISTGELYGMPKKLYNLVIVAYSLFEAFPIVASGN